MELYVISDEDSNVLYSSTNLKDIKQYVIKSVRDIIQEYENEDITTDFTKEVVIFLDANPVNKIIVGANYTNENRCSSLQKLRIDEIFDISEYDPNRVKYKDTLENLHKWRYYADYKHKNYDYDNEEDMLKDFHSMISKDIRQSYENEDCEAYGLTEEEQEVIEDIIKKYKDNSYFEKVGKFVIETKVSHDEITKTGAMFHAEILNNNTENNLYYVEIFSPEMYEKVLKLCVRNPEREFYYPVKKQRLE